MISWQNWKLLANSASTVRPSTLAATALAGGRSLVPRHARQYAGFGAHHPDAPRFRDLAPAKQCPLLLWQFDWGRWKTYAGEGLNVVGKLPEALGQEDLRSIVKVRSGETGGRKMGDTGQNISLEFPYFPSLSHFCRFWTIFPIWLARQMDRNFDSGAISSHSVPFPVSSLVDDPLAGHRNKERQTTDRAAQENIRCNYKRMPLVRAIGNCQRIGGVQGLPKGRAMP